MEFLQDNGQWLAAAGTLLLAIVALITLLQNRALVKQNRIAVWRPYYTELIATVIDPLLKSTEASARIHKRRQYSWQSTDEKKLREDLPDLEDLEPFRLDADRFHLPTLGLHLEGWAGSLSQARYSDFKQAHGGLTHAIEKYNEDSKRLEGVLLALAKELLSSELGLEGRVRADLVNQSGLRKNTLFCAEEIWKALLQGTELGGPGQIRQFLQARGASLMQKVQANDSVMKKHHQACQQADHLAAQVESIEADLRAAKDKYTLDFGITEEMVTRSAREWNVY